MEFGKILNLYTPNEPLYAVFMEREVNDDTGRNELVAYSISKVDYLAICEDGDIHPMELEDGYYDFCDRYEFFMGYYNEKQLREFYEDWQRKEPNAYWYVKGYEIKKVDL